MMVCLLFSIIWLLLSNRERRLVYINKSPRYPLLFFPCSDSNIYSPIQTYATCRLITDRSNHGGFKRGHNADEHAAGDFSGL